MTNPVRLGVIGLRAGWRSYQKVLQQLASESKLSAVFDPCPRRARQQAKWLGCDPVGGVVELVERNDIDAVLLPCRTWMDYWPVQQAQTHGKPVLCVHAPLDWSRLRLLQNPAEANLVHLTLCPDLELGINKLRERLDSHRSEYDLLQITYTRSKQSASGDVRDSTALLPLMRACGTLLQAEPRRVRCYWTAESPQFASVVLEFDRGRAQLTILEGTQRDLCELRWQNSCGTARLQVPGWLEWQDKEGKWAQRLPRTAGKLWALQRFIQGVRQGVAPSFGLAELARWREVVGEIKRG